MSVREHEESLSHTNWPTQSPDFTPLKVFGMCWKRLKEWFDSQMQMLMQLWMEINVVRLHKVVKKMPQQMRSVI